MTHFFYMSTNNTWSKQNVAFVYYGQKGENIPDPVICIRIHPSVRVIHGRAFLQPEQTKAIKEEVFEQCTSQQEILIPSAIRTIKRRAFSDCLSLTTVILSNGLEEIRVKAFINNAFPS